MSPHELYALVGSLSLGTLTLLYALQWRDNHQPWAVRGSRLPFSSTPCAMRSTR